MKVTRTWRYCKAAYHDNRKIKPDIVFVNVKEGLLEEHPEGRYYMSHNSGWIDAGTDAAEAQRKQRLALDEHNRLNGKTFAHSSLVAPGTSGKMTLPAAAEKYFANCEARGLDPRPSASFGPQLIRLSSIAALRMLTSAGTTSRSCSTILFEWPCGNEVK